MSPAMYWILFVILFLIMVGIFSLNGTLQEIRNIFQKRVTSARQPTPARRRGHPVKSHAERESADPASYLEDDEEPIVPGDDNTLPPRGTRGPVA